MVDEEEVLASGSEKAAEPAETEAVTQPGPPPKPEKQPRTKAWIGYLVLVAVVALLVGGWFLLREMRSTQDGPEQPVVNETRQTRDVKRQAGVNPQNDAGNQEQTAELSQFWRKLSSVQEEMVALRRDMTAVLTQKTAAEENFEQRITRESTRLQDHWDVEIGKVKDRVDDIETRIDYTRGDVLIADVEYLLSVADLRKNLTGDIKSVIKAMEAANHRLRDTRDPSMSKVREELRKEIEKLEKTPVPHIDDISNRLLSLEDKVKNLPLFLPHAGMAKERGEKPEAGSAKKGAEGDVLDSTLESIKDLVKIRRTDRMPAEVLTPEEAEVLREILLLKFEATRAALLRSDEQLYKDSLNSALKWVKENFDTAAAETNEVVTEIEKLLKEPVSVSFPDISKSLVEIRKISEQRMEAPRADEKGESGTGNQAPGAQP